MAGETAVATTGTRQARLQQVARSVLPGGRALALAVLLTTTLNAGACQEPDAGTLEVSFNVTQDYPLSTAGFLAGLLQEPLLTSADFVATASTRAEAGPVSVPANGVLPLVAAVVLASAETVAVVREEINLNPGYRHIVSVWVLPNLSGGLICSSPIGRSALQQVAPDPPDTLYVWYAGIEPGRLSVLTTYGPCREEFLTTFPPL